METARWKVSGVISSDLTGYNCVNMSGLCHVGLRRTGCPGSGPYPGPAAGRRPAMNGLFQLCTFSGTAKDEFSKFQI